MPDKNKPGMGFEVNIRSKSENSLGSTPLSNAPETTANSPFCIAVLGDFSGLQKIQKSPADLKSINNRRFIEIDRDNFEEVMAGFKISLNLNMGEESIEIKINDLDDFHPDELYDKVETFSKLRSLRRRLKNNKTFADAASEIQGWLPDTENTLKIDTDATDATDATEAIAPPENLLDDILSVQQNQSASAATTEATHIDKLIKSIVAPYVEPASDPRQEEMIEMVDKATEIHMRDILHHPDFQASESAWQSLYFMIKRLESDPKLKVMLLDISKQELQLDLAVDDITTSAIYKKFCDGAAGDLPWSLLLGNYTFADTIDDVLSLANIGEVAKQSNASFIAAASETLAGCESFAKTPDYEDWNYEISEGVNEAWQLVRKSSVAEHIGLALPRFLLRLPYGNKSKPVESFSFEEMTDEHCHECYLWGNAAFIKAEMLARNFTSSAWKMTPREVYQTDGLPLFYYQDEGETVAKAVAEIYMKERGGEIINSQGLISLWSVKNADSIRSVDYQSISENSEELKGRWS